MNRTVTLSAKGVLVTLVAALALLVAYLLGNGGGTAQASPSGPSGPSESSAPSAPSVPSGHARTLVMTGTGHTVGVPDELSFSVSVGLVRPDLSGAFADANATMRRVLAALASSGVRRSDVQTTALSMNAVYDYHASGPPTLRGYRVSQSAQVLVRDLAKGGTAVTAAVRAGGNDVRVGRLGLRVADPEALLAKSRADAVKEATAKAQEYADATGQTLGAVMSLREVHLSAPAVRTQSFPLSSMDAVRGALPIRAGKDKLSVTVRIEWAFA